MIECISRKVLQDVQAEAIRENHIYNVVEQMMGSKGSTWAGLTQTRWNPVTMVATQKQVEEYLKQANSYFNEDGTIKSPLLDAGIRRFERRREDLEERLKRG